MRRIISSTFTSLDGVMQAPGGPPEDPTGGFAYGGWFAPMVDEKVVGILDRIFSRPFDLLLGRKTYDIFAAHWPYTGPDDEMGRQFDRITKYVATRNNDLKLSWQNSTSLGTDVVGTLKSLKASDGPDLLIQGSSDLIQTLLAERLIDEMTVFVSPVLLGKGKKLFGAGTCPGSLKATRTETTPSGMMVATYEPNGDVAIGDFSPPEPSDAEMERRRTLS